jgi:TRAP-type C4-dicarboxylate transport system substrate-binding protein
MMAKKRNLLLDLSLFLFGLGLLLGNEPLAGTAAAGDLPAVNWRMQCAYPPPEELFPGIPGAYGQALKLAKMVNEASKGKFQIEVYPAGALFKTSEVFNAVSGGAIEMASAAPVYWGGKMPEAAVQFGLPGFMVSYEQAKKMLWEKNWFQILRPHYEKHGVYLLADVEATQYNMILSFQCHTPGDLKGKKIRASGIMAKAMKLWGAAPVKTEPSEIYIALQRGTIDGTMYPAYAGITYKLFEVAKYATWPGLAAPVFVSMIVNHEAYGKLPQTYRDLLNEQAEKWSKWCFDVRAPAADKYTREHAQKDFGAEMIDWSPETVRAFLDLSAPIWDEFRKKSPDCAALVDLQAKAKDF